MVIFDMFENCLKIVTGRKLAVRAENRRFIQMALINVHHHETDTDFLLKPIKNSSIKNRFTENSKAEKEQQGRM